MMKNFLKSNWLLVLVGSLLYLGVTFGVIVSSVGALQSGVKAHDVVQGEKAVLDGPSWNYVNPALNDLIIELRTRLDKVTEKEDELKLWELQLEQELAHLRNITNAVQSLRSEVNLAANQLTQTEEDSIKRLLGLFKTLEPTETAALLDRESDVQIAKIFRLLKPDEFGPIIQLWLKQGGEHADRVHRILNEYKGVSTDQKTGG